MRDAGTRDTSNAGTVPKVSNTVIGVKWARPSSHTPRFPVIFRRRVFARLRNDRCGEHSGHSCCLPCVNRFLRSYDLKSNLFSKGRETRGAGSSPFAGGLHAASSPCRVVIGIISFSSCGLVARLAEARCRAPLITRHRKQCLDYQQMSGRLAPAQAVV